MNCWLKTTELYCLTVLETRSLSGGMGRVEGCEGEFVHASLLASGGSGVLLEQVPKYGHMGSELDNIWVEAGRV